ncbi:integral membrane protein [Colletotrichum plurivorum]|uniref:Integral membrane protein n=1 Tax=Colletotrichum plurivorum TaxID=2175906 RepID=A0A8H6NTA0_9PEZI|nr:integral membrane protein [Colletotrichum plurivorum]
MGLYTDPPPFRTFRDDKPSLLVCWWITSFCTLIILLRVAGRFIRTEKLFREDKVAALALIPLWLRMVCVHFVLLYGTNNAQLDPNGMTQDALDKKAIASGLVLASRIFYAATLWILKNTILEFFKRLTGVTWARSYEQTLVFIRCTLVATFVAIIVSDLAECRPINHYWQVTPDPGGQCRQGFAHLITMATCNVITDALLVFFPIPIILRSQMRVKRKVQLTLLFSLSLAVIGVTAYRVPHVIREHGQQQLRSVLASVELLFATTAANALVLGSFVRDRGLKKQKFKYGSVAADSMDRSSDSRRPTLHRHWGSDEDLVRDVGLGVEPNLRERPDAHDDMDDSPRYTPAPLARPFGEELRNWQFPQRKRSNAERSDASLLPHDQFSSSRSNSTVTPRRVSFFDVGGLLSEDQLGGAPTFRRDSLVSSVDPMSSGHGIPSPTLPAPTSGVRRGSTALLQDLGGLLGPINTKQSRQKPRSGTELQPIPQSQHDDHPSYNPRPGEPTLNDLGGLLK